MNNYIDDDLLQQKELLINILNLTMKQFSNAYEALLNMNYDVAKKVIINDELINQLHDNFINTSLWKIAKQQMVACDLRQVIGFIIIVREIERIADYAMHLATYLIKYNPTNNLIENKLKLPIKNILKMLKYVHEIIITGNLSLAYRMPKYEDKINSLFKIKTNELLSQTINLKNTKEIKLINVTLQQLKYIERAGDHLVNIAELLIYIKEGTFFDLSLQAAV